MRITPPMNKSVEKIGTIGAIAFFVRAAFPFAWNYRAVVRSNICSPLVGRLYAAPSGISPGGRDVSACCRLMFHVKHSPFAEAVECFT